jgi:hypothetical protein
VDRRDDVGTGQVEEIRVALEIAIVVGEPLAPEVGLGKPPALQQHAPGPVEHDDALAEKGLQPGSYVCDHVDRDYPRPLGSRGASHRLAWPGRSGVGSER